MLNVIDISNSLVYYNDKRIIRKKKASYLGFYLAFYFVLEVFFLFVFIKQVRNRKKKRGFIRSIKNIISKHVEP